MKKCPKCSATFNDDMAFCLNDGTSLVADTTPDLPATVIFSGQQAPLTQGNESPRLTQGNNPPPIVVNIAPEPSFQQPQFGQQPSYNQPAFGMPPARSGSSFGIGKIIAVAVVLIIGLVSIIGGLGAVFYFSRSRSTASTTSNASNYNASNYTSTSNNRSTTNTSSTPSNRSTANDQDVSQADTKNGFKQVAFEDVTSRGFFPGANKTSAATFADGSNRVVSFASAYDSPGVAESAFKDRIAEARKDGSTITEEYPTYAYYNKSGTYSVDLYTENKLYEFSTKNQQVLYRFAKKSN